MKGINSFKQHVVNVIIVVGHEKLNVEMQRTYGSQLAVVKIPKSGGVSYLSCNLFQATASRRYDEQVVELDHSYRERVHGYQLHAYMYGHVIPTPAGVSNGTVGGEALTDLALAPSSTVINFNDLSMYRIGAGLAIYPSSPRHRRINLGFSRRNYGTNLRTPHWSKTRCI